jgi:hypothetical protein
VTNISTTGKQPESSSVHLGPDAVSALTRLALTLERINQARAGKSAERKKPTANSDAAQ